MLMAFESRKEGGFALYMRLDSKKNANREKLG